jgi:hypothetical protein
LSSSCASQFEFSVKNTSAGEWLPSCSICAVRTSSSSLLTATLIPVCFVNAATSAEVVSGCWAL